MLRILIQFIIDIYHRFIMSYNESKKAAPRRLVQLGGSTVQLHQRPRWPSAGLLAILGLDSGFLADPQPDLKLK